MTDIVQVNVSQTIAPAPSTLQRTGAFISQGGTNTAVNTASLLTQLSDLTTLLEGSHTLSGVLWSGGTATATTTAPHGYTVSDMIELTVAGCTPSGYNGTYVCTITGTSTFTYAISNPGTTPASVAGSYTPEDVSELVAMATTFFAQGGAASVYVLELGAGDASDGVTVLTTYITANPNAFYSYLVPRYWDGDSSFLAYLASFESTTAKTYFWITTTTGTYTDYTTLMKCAVVLIEAPGIPIVEFSLAAAFYVALNYNPSTTNLVTPFAFSFLVGVTPYPTKGNAALLTTLQTAFVNIVGTGAEGGISNTLLLYGTTKDGRDFTYWYSVDWVQINIKLNLTNEIINGSNNPLAPLYYDQNGINRLQKRAQATMNNGVSFGLVLSPVTVNAVPFAIYVEENPSDYEDGTYDGLSVVYTPQRGFKKIIFNVNVTDFPLGQ